MSMANLGKFCLGIFYFSLGNIPPKFRSQLSAIYLVAITRHQNVTKYGMDSILCPFVDDMKKLVSKNGIHVNVHNLLFIRI